jgi:hypothetical protein
MWEIVFLMVVLKIPIVYLCAVVWWAIKAEPKPADGAATRERLDWGPEPPGRWTRRVGRPRPGPHAGPTRRSPRPARNAVVGAGRRR